jgi:hypothetical protein
MLSEKSYYILLAIIIFAFIYYFKKSREDFSVQSKCSMELAELKKYHANVKLNNDLLEQKYNEKKTSAAECRDYIDGSIKNLKSTQDRALDSANKQLKSAANAILHLENTGQGIKEALELQKKAEEMIQDSDKSAKELQNYLSEVTDNNKAFAAEHKKYVGNINLGRLSNLFKTAESFTDLPKPPPLEYFRKQEGEWRDDWKNKLNGIVLPNSLEPKDYPNNVNIPFVMNGELEENLDKTTSQYIAAKVNYMWNTKMIPEAKRIIREMNH